MPPLEIHRIDEADLPAVGEYVHRVVNQTPALAQDLPVSSGHTAAEFLRIFRWRTVDNPARPADLELGHCIRRDNSEIAGVHLVCPFRYRRGEHRLTGLASSTYFADDDARMQAFFLFRRFLALAGFDFYFANTCNVYSARVWEKCGGRSAPDSEKQWLVPLRIGPLVREMLVRRGWKRLAGLGRAAGSVADLIGGKPAASELKLEPTNDLQYMAESAELWRNPSHLVPDRDSSYLRWQYHEGPAAQCKTVFRFQDAATGRDGWIAVSVGPAGVDRNLEVATIADWVVPPPPFDFANVVRAVARHFAGAADAVVFRPRLDMAMTSRVPRLRQRKYPAPQYYLMPARREEQGWEQVWITSQADAV